MYGSTITDRRDHIFSGFDVHTARHTRGHSAIVQGWGGGVDPARHPRTFKVWGTSNTAQGPNPVRVVIVVHLTQALSPWQGAHSNLGQGYGHAITKVHNPDKGAQAPPLGKVSTLGKGGRGALLAKVEDPDEVCCNDSCIRFHIV